MRELDVTPGRTGDGPSPSADGDRLDPRVRWLWTAWATLAALGATLAVTVATATLFDPAAAVPAGAVVLLGGLVAAGCYPALRYARWRYRLTDLGLELSHGVFRHVDTAIPYLRIQHIDVAQGPLERGLGLVSLVVHTAAATADVALPGIPEDRATQVRRRLLDRAVTAAQGDAGDPDAV